MISEIQVELDDRRGIESIEKEIERNDLRKVFLSSNQSF